MLTAKKIAAVAAAAMCMISFAGCESIEYRSFDTSSSSQAEISSSSPESSETDSSSSSTDGPISDQPLQDPNSDPLITKEDDPDYLSKTAFIGEALCSGLSVYGDNIQASQVYAENNAHVDDIAQTSWDVNGEQLSLPDALYKTDRKYVYIWIGPNDLNNYDPKTFAMRYKDLINEIYHASPMAYVGVISIAPVSEQYDKTLSFGTVYDFNAALAEMIDGIGNNRVYFFNITSVLGDSNGHLKSEYDSGDGLHLTADAYKAVEKHLVNMQIHPYLSDLETDEELPTEGEVPAE